MPRLHMYNLLKITTMSKTLKTVKVLQAPDQTRMDILETITSLKEFRYSIYFYEVVQTHTLLLLCLSYNTRKK